MINTSSSVTYDYDRLRLRSCWFGGLNPDTDEEFIQYQTTSTTKQTTFFSMCMDQFESPQSLTHMYYVYTIYLLTLLKCFSTFSCFAIWGLKGTLPSEVPRGLLSNTIAYSRSLN